MTQARDAAERLPLRLIGVPMDLGADRRGVDMGPSAFRSAGFSAAVRRLGYEVRDFGNIEVATPEVRQFGRSNAKYLDEIVEACDALRAAVLQALEAGEMPIVVGGDHSIGAGTVAGVAEYHKKHGQPIGLLWIDAHADMNTPESSPSGNVHGMPLSACLGLGAPELTGLGGFRPKVDPQHVVLIGIRALDRREKEIVHRSGVHAYTMRDIDERGIAVIMREAFEYLGNGTAGYHVSLDVDGLDPDIAPGVGTPVRGGISFREAHLLMELVADDGRALSFEVAEINPILDHRNKTAEIAVDLFLSGLGKSIL
ncbi:MAG TPA: arginase [Planctomycetota bacterium]|nr:arginase [Planctomycetota bacterium]